MSNKQIKQILEKIMSKNGKHWVDKLVDTLWAYRTTFKTPFGMSPYRVVYSKPCHLPMEIEHKAWWAIKKLNYDLTEVGEERRLQLGELDEIRVEAYDSARSYKERAKLFHDRHIFRKQFTAGMKVLLYDSKLHLFPGKLRSRWMGPYIVSHVFPYGAVEIQDPHSGATFKVNGQRLKQFQELSSQEDVECLILHKQSPESMIVV